MELEYGKFNKDSILVASDAKISPGKLSASEAELELRKEVAKGRKISSTNLYEDGVKKGKKINLMLLITILQQSNELCL
jgi:hypothetical protein